MSSLKVLHSWFLFFPGENPRTLWDPPAGGRTKETQRTKLAAEQTQRVAQLVLPCQPSRPLGSSVEWLVEWFIVWLIATFSFVSYFLPPSFPSHQQKRQCPPSDRCCWFGGSARWRLRAVVPPWPYPLGAALTSCRKTTSLEKALVRGVDRPEDGCSIVRRFDRNRLRRQWRSLRRRRHWRPPIVERDKPVDPTATTQLITPSQVTAT